MARNNGTFRYTALPLEATRDEATGFYTDDDAPVWVKGCECQVEKFIPAKQRLGTDGQMYSYTFDVFLPSYFEGDLSIGARVEVTLERGGVDAVSCARGFTSVSAKSLKRPRAISCFLSKVKSMILTLLNYDLFLFILFYCASTGVFVRSAL